MTWTKPAALRPGDLIALTSPAGAVDAERVARGAAELEALGFRVRVPEGIAARERFTAGSRERRLQELHGLFADDEVAGIVAARGGAGAAWLLPLLDPGLIAAHPKAFVGYSDLTFVHLYLNRLGLMTFHGPMAARELADGSYDRDSLLRALGGEGLPYATEPDDLLPLRAGVGKGRLRGGCLSILAAAAGTPWALAADDAGTLLFLEDVDEPPYRIDRMLWQLREAGAFHGVRGVVFGDMKGCSPGLDAGYALEDVILGALDGLDLPIALGLSSGHASGPAVTLPLGARARLACEGGAARLELLEAAVC